MIEAVIFDMDGVISDTQNPISEIEERQLRDYGVRINSAEITRRYAGFSDITFYQHVFRDHGIAANAATASREKWDIVLRELRGNIKPIDGTPELIRHLKEGGMKLGVASASCREFIELVLTELAVKQYFDVYASSDEVAHGKPEPDIFLYVARQLGIPPARCTVIEDGVNGMTAAKRAGMKCIGLVNSTGEYPADFLIRSMNELTVSRIREL